MISMKRFLLLLPLAFIGHQLTAQGQTSATQQPKHLLFDFRLNRTTAPLKIPLATQRTILGKVFRRYLTDEAKCNTQFQANGSDPLKAARTAGQIVPSIVGMSSGSFTAPGQTETLYLISVGECNASHADNFGTKRAAIFSGQQLVADVDADFKINIESKTDLNGDGLNELLLSGGDMNQGVLIETAALVDFPNGRRRVIEDFGTVTEDSCASGLPGSMAKASVIYLVDAAAGQMPKLRIENFQASCRTPKRWRFLSTGKMQE